MDTLILRNMQNEELEIMRVIDQFCREHGISYSLYAGTAIGAVRHHGFIPWDDDIDICMTRAELNRFRKCWNQHPVEGYYFENCLDDRYCGIAHTKVHKEDTLFLSEGKMNLKVIMAYGSIFSLWIRFSLGGIQECAISMRLF